MGGGLRKFFIAIAIVMSLPSISAAAEEYSACWTAEVWDSVRLRNVPITRCRVAGGEVVDYASDEAVPSVLSPNLGTDLVGPCWYLTSADTSYVVIDRFADGSATIGLDLDPGDPGIAIVGTFLRCTSEPTPLTEPLPEAWEYVMSYIHNPPNPDLNPQPGDGITGLGTYIGVDIPPDHSATLTGGGTSIEVEIRVDAVIVDWGDGRVDTYPPSAKILAGYPDGAATHIYEIKDAEGAELSVAYDWTTRWRLTGGAWTALPVPNTTTTIIYPIAEVISHLTD